VSWLLYPGNRVLDNIGISPRAPIGNDLPYRHYVTDMSGSHMLQHDKAGCPRAESVNSNKMYGEEGTVVGMQASGNFGNERSSSKYFEGLTFCTTLILEMEKRRGPRFFTNTNSRESIVICFQN
jgi:hypothetical protein